MPVKVLCAVVVFWTLAGLCAGAAPEPAAYHPGRILVVPKPGRETAVANLHRVHRAQVRNHFPDVRNIHVVELPPGSDISKAVHEYRQSGHVEAAEPDYIRRATLLPNDPYVSDGTQWHLHNTGQSQGRADADIDAPEAWDTATSASDVIVAVLDTGVRYTHEDLAENIWTNPGEIPGNGLDDDGNGFTDDVHGFTVFTGDVDDLNGHGTHVAGILGGVGNNGIGICGVAWRVKIMICKFLSSSGFGYDSDAIRCMNYARTNGARILNCSWGSEDYSSVLSSAINSLHSSGIMVVAAAGNDGQGTYSYPAAFGLANILSVGATTRTDTRPNYSATGRIFAPGSDIWSTLHHSDDSYGLKSGTSMATPCVAGAAAILWSVFPSERYTNIIDRLVLSAEYPGVPGGPLTRLNLANALSLVAKCRFRANRYSGVLPLNVDFTDTSFGNVTNRIWSFGDGTFATNIAHPSHTFSSTGLFNVVLTITATNGLSSSATQSIAATLDFPYVISRAPFDWISNDMETVVLTNGIRSAPQPLPFPFEFYGQTYSEIYLFAYGLASFSAPGFGDVFSGQNMPTTFAPNAIISPYWMWMKATNGGRLLTGQQGTAPHRKAVFSWVDVAQINTDTNRFTFQVILHESGHVTMQYRDVENASFFYALGRNASIGIENDTGMVAAKYSFMGVPNLVSNRHAIVYSPPGYIAAPPRLKAGVSLFPGQVDLLAFSAPGQTCVLETSTDLTAWRPLSTNPVPASGIFRFVVTNPAPPHLFFRLALP